MEIPEIKSNQKQDIENDKILQPIAKNPGRLNDDPKRSVAGELFKSDMKEVGQYIFWDVVVRALKDVLIEVGHSTVDAIFGGTKGGYRSRPSNMGTRASYVPYNSYSDDRRYREERRDPRDTSIYIDPIVSSRGEADDIMLTARDILDKYGFLKVGDLYELCNISTRPEHFRYGWENIASYNIRRIRDGYVIEMPKVVPYR